jgi:hypothetical protein
VVEARILGRGRLLNSECAAILLLRCLVSSSLQEGWSSLGTTDEDILRGCIRGGGSSAATHGVVLILSNFLRDLNA